MKLNGRLIAKLALLLVIIGFFMPVACDRTGFEIAQSMVKSNNNVLGGILMYLLLASAAAGFIIGVFLLMKKKVNPGCDWIVIIACIASGLIVYFRTLSGRGPDPELQPGAYVIITGWVIALCAQVFSQTKKGK